MTYEFITSDQARQLTGHETNDSFTVWVRRYNEANPIHRILKLGHRYDRFSIERAILKLNGLEAAQ